MEVLKHLLARLFFSLLVVLAAVVLLRLARLFIQRLSKGRMKGLPRKKLMTLYSILHSVLRALIYFLAAVMILDIFGINTASLIATAGIGGIAFAFGAQKIIADVFSGIFLPIDGRLEVGDYITVGGISGTVQRLELRHTIIADYTGALHIFPNSQIGVITNYGKGNIRCDAKIAVPYAISTEESRAMVERAAARLQAEEAKLYTEAISFLGVEESGPFTYTILVGAATKSGDQWAGARRLREAVISEMENLLDDGRGAASCDCRAFPPQDASDRRASERPGGTRTDRSQTAQAAASLSASEKGENDASAKR